MTSPHPSTVMALLVYPRRNRGDVSVLLNAAPDALPPTLAIRSHGVDAPTLDVFALFDDSDLPRFVTYLFRETVSRGRSRSSTRHGADSDGRHRRGHRS